MTKPKDSPLSNPSARLTMAPTPELVALLERRWPVRISRHAIMQIGLRRGLSALAELPVAECKTTLVEELTRQLEQPEP